ncbi:tetratricopeptide repeat-containing sulfotransferase family protein [Pseudooceanicola aestuarii]|uniref:tetratricopeptide repeat-containing sulfotransferase family protein n=1 Tax=Pseudooceanicola aestuarii TaxID=2697319 RepID=UPI0013D38914|nr:sulfotransferase [Pseudooceanicola aestuarii]
MSAPHDAKTTDAIATAAACLTRREFEAFDKALDQAAALAPDDPEVIHLRGLGLFERKRTPEAFPLVLQAARARPRNTAMLHNLAAIQISLGHFKDAEANLRRAIRLQPDYAEAYHTLAGIHRFAPDDPLIPAMEELGRSRQFTPRDASFLCFALAKAQDDANRPDHAWPLLEQANAQMPAEYDADGETRDLDRTLEICTADFLHDRQQYGHPSPAPIFIVGMPRSGTTLLESLLDAHPQVHAAGELPVIPAMGRALAQRHDLPPARQGHGPTLARLTPAELHGSGLGYLNAVRDTSRRWFDRFTDKLPDNALNLGLIAGVLPRARVLHIMRHPLDVMLSIYFQRFTSVPYGFRPADIAAHWRNYRRAMAHWRQVLPPGMLLELRYENLVQDRDFAQSLVWDHLGLTGQVGHVRAAPGAAEQRTASRWQVKQPVYQSSRQKFRRYAHHMGAFIDALGGMAEIDRIVAQQEARCALRAAATTG